MPAPHSHIRHGVGAVRPYLYGSLGLPDFLVRTFGAVVLEKANEDNGIHAELQIGDSVLVIEAGELPVGVTPWMASVYVYVEDVDAVYARAMSLGATSLAPPQDKPYSERQAGFTDETGNTWWVASYRPA
jgi:PhnB protein